MAGLVAPDVAEPVHRRCIKQETENVAHIASAAVPSHPHYPLVEFGAKVADRGLLQVLVCNPLWAVPGVDLITSCDMVLSLLSMVLIPFACGFPH